MPTPLTPTERRILIMCANGMKTIDIGRSMTPPVELSSINRRLAVIFAKLGARNKTHAVGLAMKHRLIDPDAVEHEDR